MSLIASSPCNLSLLHSFVSSSKLSLAYSKRIHAWSVEDVEVRNRPESSGSPSVLIILRLMIGSWPSIFPYVKGRTLCAFSCLNPVHGLRDFRKRGESCEQSLLQCNWKCMILLPSFARSAKDHLC